MSSPKYMGSSWIFHSQREKYAFCILRSIFMMSSDLAFFHAHKKESNSLLIFHQQQRFLFVDGSVHEAGEIHIRKNGAFHYPRDEMGKNGWGVWVKSDWWNFKKYGDVFSNQNGDLNHENYYNSSGGLKVGEIKLVTSCFCLRDVDPGQDVWNLMQCEIWLCRNPSLTFEDLKSTRPSQK